MKKPPILFAIFSIILAITVFLRFYRFEGFVTFLGDQGRDAIIVRDIVTLKHLPAIGAPTSVGQVYLGPFYYYLIAPFLLLFNFNPVGLAFGVALLSLIGTFFVYLVIKKYMTAEIALLTMAFIAFSSVLIDLARFSWNPNLLPFFTFFSIYFFYKWLEENSFIYALLWGAFLSFCLQLHYLAVFSFIPYLLYIIYYFLKSSDKKKYVFSTMVGIFSFVIFTSPLIIFDLRHQFINSNNFLKLFAEGGVGGDATFINKLFETIQAFMQESLQIEMSIYVAVLIFLTIIVTNFWIYKQNKNTFLLMNILNILFFVAGFSLLTSFRHAHYFGPAYISFYLLLAFLPFTIKNNLIRYSVISAALGFFIFTNGTHYYFIFQNPNNQISHARKVAEFMAPKINNKPYNIATWPVGFTEDPYVYFLTLKGLRPADRKKVEITDQMFVLCEKEPCMILNSPSWNISMFGRSLIERTWNYEGLIIYKLVHETGS